MCEAEEPRGDTARPSELSPAVPCLCTAPAGGATASPEVSSASTAQGSQHTPSLTRREQRKMGHHARARWLLFLVMGSLCSGCAIGVKHNYADAIPQLTVAGTGTLAVATHDQRPYIVSGDTVPEFVGLSRGGYGNPFKVQTESARPLAEDMTRVLCTALHTQGFQCVPVLVAARDSAEEVQRKLHGVAGTLALLLVLHEWKSDTYINTALI